MESEMIPMDGLWEERVRALGLPDDPQGTMTTALGAARFFGGNIERSRSFLREHGSIPSMLSKSQLNRRLHAIPREVWLSFFRSLGEIHRRRAPTQAFIISLPGPVGDDIRIRRGRLYRGEVDRGPIATKRRSFYGLRVHRAPHRVHPPVGP